jgi:hypothetical protein
MVPGIQSGPTPRPPCPIPNVLFMIATNPQIDTITKRAITPEIIVFLASACSSDSFAVAYLITPQITYTTPRVINIGMTTFNSPAITARILNAFGLSTGTPPGVADTKKGTTIKLKTPRLLIILLISKIKLIIIYKLHINSELWSDSQIVRATGAEFIPCLYYTTPKQVKEIKMGINKAYWGRVGIKVVVPRPNVP